MSLLVSLLFVFFQTVIPTQNTTQSRLSKYHSVAFKLSATNGLKRINEMVQELNNENVDMLLAELSDLLNGNVIIKLELSTSCNKMKRMLFPFLHVRHELIKQKKRVAHFPNIELPPSALNNHLVIRFYQTIAASNKDIFFAGKLFGLKLIDYHCNKHSLSDVSFDDIISLIITKQEIIYGYVDWEIFGIIYNVSLYDSESQFWEKYVLMHSWLFNYSGFMNKFGVDHNGNNNWKKRVLTASTLLDDQSFVMTAHKVLKIKQVLEFDEIFEVPKK